jgi:hypothetical protein
MTPPHQTGALRQQRNLERAAQRAARGHVEEVVKRLRVRVTALTNLERSRQSRLALL